MYDTIQNVELLQVIEENGRTTMIFQREVDTGDVLQDIPAKDVTVRTVTTINCLYSFVMRLVVMFL